MKIAFVLLVNLMLASPGFSAWAKWAVVNKSPLTGGISGMVSLDKTRFLIVHDNKTPADSRVAVVECKGGYEKPQYRAMPWPPDARFPVDLEGLAIVPGTSNTAFLAVESSGCVTEFALSDDASSIEVVKEFKLPTIETNDNYEGFTLWKSGERVLAIWAHRGGNGTPAKLGWGAIDLDSGTFSDAQTKKITVPWPNRSDMRAISDICVDQEGAVIISSASDGGNDGPFASALYRIGKIGAVKDGLPTIEFEPKPVELQRFRGHKIEGVTAVEGGFAVGTDDENKGSALCVVKIAAKTHK